MVFKCSLPGCVETNKTTILHCLSRDREVRQKWCEAIYRPDLLDATDRQRHNFRICDIHFADDAKFETNRNRTNLKYYAIPTLYLPEAPKLNKIELDVFACPEDLEEMHEEILRENHIEKEVSSPIPDDQCRTCLSILEKNSSKRITDICLLDKSIKDVIVFLVPELDSKLSDDELVCKNCVAVLESTMNFIVKCLEVEAALDKCKENVTVDKNNTPLERCVNKEDQGNEVQIKIEVDPFESLDVEHDYCVKIVSTDDVEVPKELGDQNNLQGECDNLALAAEMVEQSLLDYCAKNDDTATANFANIDVEARRKDATFSCATCFESFGEKEEYEFHLEIHPPHICEICGKAYRKKESIRAHLLTHNSPNSYICEVCGKGFKEQGSLRAHLKSHQSNKSFMCDKCSKVFKNRRLLDIHIKYVHNKFYGSQCTVCGILCRTPANVKTHMRLVHFKEKPYECNVCQRRFGRSDYLHNHKLRHTGESLRLSDKVQSEPRKVRRRTKMGFKIIDPGEPVPCKFCGQWYKDLLRLKRHLETHLKRYPCQFCSLTFPRNILRLKHEEMHRGGTVSFFRCNVCWKKYKTKEALDEHATCHSNPQHFCDVCGKTFNRKYLLSQHKMMEHSSIPDKEQPEEIIYDSLLEVGALPT